MAPQLAPLSCLLPPCLLPLSALAYSSQQPNPLAFAAILLLNCSLVEPVWRTRSQGSELRRLAPSFPHSFEEPGLRLEGPLAVMLHRYATLHPTIQCPLPSCVPAAACSLLLVKTRASIARRLRG